MRNIVVDSLQLIIEVMFLPFLLFYGFFVLEKSVIEFKEKKFNEENQQLVCKNIKNSLISNYNKIMIKTAEKNDEVLLIKNFNENSFLVSKEDYVYNYKKRILVLRKNPYIYFKINHCGIVSKNDIFVNIKNIEFK